jgi:hypothetical protein
MRNDEIDSVHIRNDMVFLILSETGKRRKTSKRPCFSKCDTDGEVIFATASTLTHQVFNSLPNINRAYFRLRQQYQKR